MEVLNFRKTMIIDKQMVGFKSHHVEKLWISYKKEGDDFQCDGIYCNGLTYSFLCRI
jgi:hypothetical protein